jgi:hypothetical protein
MPVSEHPAPFVRREIDIDDEPETPGEPRAGASVTWVILAAGLALSLLLFKFGIWFFFLPIIVPFGLRGRSLAPRRRTIRLEGGILSLEKRSLFGSSREGAVDVRDGVVISVVRGGFSPDRGARATMRIASAAGALDVRCADATRAHEIGQQVESMLAEAGVRVASE